MPAGCDPVNKEPSLTLAGVLLYHAEVSSASSMAFPNSSSSWEHVLFLWTSWSQLDPTFSAAQPLTQAAPALGEEGGSCFKLADKAAEVIELLLT